MSKGFHDVLHEKIALYEKLYQYYDNVGNEQGLEECRTVLKVLKDILNAVDKL